MLLGLKPENFGFEEYRINLWQSLPIVISVAKVYLYELGYFYPFQIIEKFLQWNKIEQLWKLKTKKNKNQIFTNIPIYIYTLAKVNKIFPPLENSGTYTEAKTLFWKICIKFHFFPKRFWKMYWYGCFPSNFVKYFKTRVVLKNLYHLITSI